MSIVLRQLLLSSTLILVFLAPALILLPEGPNYLKGDLVAYIYGALGWFAGRNPYELSDLYRAPALSITPLVQRDVFNSPIIFPLIV